MNIFIVDDDVTFAHRLKERLQGAEQADRRLFPLKIELFPEPASFTEYWDKNKKDASKAPQLMFLDIQMPGKSGLDLYLDLLEEDSPLIPVIHFCSSVSYGYFERFFLNADLDLPPFVQKSRVFNELDAILEDFLAEEEVKKDISVQVNLPPHLAKKLKARFEADLERVKKHYYDIGLKTDQMGALQQLTLEFQKTANQLGLEAVVNACAHLLKEVGRERISPMKLRREIKETFAVGDAVVEKLKRS